MQDNLERIQQYFEGDMTSEERLDFEKEMTENPLLMEEVKDYKLMVSSIEKVGMKVLLNDIDLDESQMDSPTNNKSKWPLVVLLLLICLALLFALKYFNNSGPASPDKSSQPQQSENDFMQFAEAMPMLNGLPVTLSDHTSSFVDAMIAYRQDDHLQAANLFEQMIDQGMSNDTTVIYYANSLIQLQKYKDAISILSPLSVDSTSVYYYESLYYQSKAYLMNDQMDAGKKILNVLARTDNEYQAQAKELINSLSY